MVRSVLIPEREAAIADAGGPSAQTAATLLEERGLAGTRSSSEESLFRDVSGPSGAALPDPSKIGPGSFELLRVVGQGAFGKARGFLGGQ